MAGVLAVFSTVTVRVVRWLKRHEGSDVVDSHISYNVFRLRF